MTQYLHDVSAAGTNMTAMLFSAVLDGDQSQVNHYSSMVLAQRAATVSLDYTREVNQIASNLDGVQFAQEITSGRTA